MPRVLSNLTDTDSNSQTRWIRYTGPSMSPTFKPGDKLEICPYRDQKISPGDVIAFSPPGGGPQIVHRVVSVDSRGIRTQGDNNRQIDQWPLSPDHIVGRVVGLQRGTRRRRIGGGRGPQLRSAARRGIRWIDREISVPLSPLYHFLARTELFKRMTRKVANIRVVSVARPGGRELYLFLGRRVIGRCSPGDCQWQIRRPFRLCVDESLLPKTKGSDIRDTGQPS